MGGCKFVWWHEILVFNPQMDVHPPLRRGPDAALRLFAINGLNNCFWGREATLIGGFPEARQHREGGLPPCVHHVLSTQPSLGLSPTVSRLFKGAAIEQKTLSRTKR